MKKVLVALGVNERHMKQLELAAAGRAEFVRCRADEVRPEDLKGVNGIIGNVDPSLLKDAPELEWLQLNSAGMDRYVIPGVLPEGCILKNAVGAYGLTVSEHMLALTFALVRKLGRYAVNQQRCAWKDEGPVISVAGSTVLVLGLGDIGGSYAQKAKALGAYVIGVRKNLREKPSYLDEQYTLDRLDEVIGRADIIAAVLPSSPETVHLFDRERLARVKRGVYLINCGRGDLIDPEALKEALDGGAVGGAGLDVTEPEPLPAEDSLWKYENVIITPHTAGGFHLQQTFERIVELAADHLREWLDREEHA